MNDVISNDAAKSLIVVSHHLHEKKRTKSANTNDILELVQRLGWIQLDSINVVQRSHYLTLWSRLDNYDIDLFDKLIYGDSEDRKLFEYWFHCASIIPLEYYRHRMPKMKLYKEGKSMFYSEFNTDNSPILDKLRTLAKEGMAIQAKHFDDKKPEGGWWNWKQSKKALEYLYCTGELMVERRVDFNKVYNGAEFVLPSWVNKNEPTEKESDLFILEKSAKCLGLASLSEIADYSYSKISSVKETLNELIQKKILLPVKVEGTDGKVRDMILHYENIPLLEKIEEQKIKPQRTTFLNPFDNIFWAKKRTEQIFGFTHVLEAYKPENKRIWGYYSMPILYKNSLVGRLIDPKLDRKSNSLSVKAILIEKNISDNLLKEIDEVLHDFALFHKATLSDNIGIVTHWDSANIPNT